MYLFFTGPAVFLRLAVEGPVLFFRLQCCFLQISLGSRIHLHQTRIFFSYVQLFFLGLAMEGPAVFLRFGSGGSSFFKTPGQGGLLYFCPSCCQGFLSGFFASLGITVKYLMHAVNRKKMQGWRLRIGPKKILLRHF